MSNEHLAMVNDWHQWVCLVMSNIDHENMFKPNNDQRDGFFYLYGVPHMYEFILTHLTTLTELIMPT